MTVLAVMAIVLLAAVGAFVAFYRRSITPEWSTSETRRAVLNVLIAVGPLLGLRLGEPRPPRPGILAPGPERDDELILPPPSERDARGHDRSTSP